MYKQCFPAILSYVPIQLSIKSQTPKLITWIILDIINIIINVI